MPVNGVNTTTSTASTSSAGRSAAEMKSEDFFKLLIAELQYQDPFEPMDNAKMVEQISGIRNIEASTNMSAALESVTRQQNFGTAASMIGKMVTGKLTDEAGTEYTIEGVVTGVTFEKNGKVVLKLDNDASLPLEAVMEIKDLDPAAAGAQQPQAQLV